MAVTITEVSDLQAELGGERELRRSLVNKEFMMLYGNDVTGYLPPLPKKERPKSSPVGAWNNSNQAMRQLSSSSLRRGPRLNTFPAKTPQRKPPAMPAEMKRPHTSFQSHITDVLNMKIENYRPQTSHGKLESDPYALKKMSPATDDAEELITPKPIPRHETYTEDQLAAMEKLLANMDGKLRRPKLLATIAKRRRKTKKDTQKVEIDLEAKVGECISRVLGGELDNVPPDMSTLVRLFVYSNRNAMKAEREALRTDAFPVLRAYCQRLGLELVVVDMCGPSEEGTTMQYWMDEVNKCKAHSMGPYIVCLYGDYYGPYKPPLTIPADDYDIIYGVASRNNILGNELLRDSYELDENAIPAVYRLKPDSLPEEDMARLPHLIEQFSSFAVQLGQIKSEKAKKYSVHSELEIFMRQGLIDRKTSVRSKSLLFVRKFTAIEEDLDNKVSSQYKDTIQTGSTVKVDEKKAKMKDLLLEEISEKLNEIDVKTYEVPWTGSGIDKQEPEHQEYMEQFVQDFTENVKRQIDLNKQSWNIKNPLYKFYREARQHSELCESHHRIFGGRQNSLALIRRCITLCDEANNCPMFITGARGMGKSCLLSAIAKLYPHWLEKQNAVTMVRFVGTTIRSSRLRNIMVDICKQACYIYHMEEPQRQTRKTPDSIVRFFFNMLEIISKHFGEDRPLLIAIDGIEKFGKSDRADTLFWIPQRLPKNVHLVLSFASENSELLEKLKVKFEDHIENFINLKQFDAEDLTMITQRVLDANKKRITQVQSELLKGVCNEDANPLFVHHMLCEAVGWKSSDTVGRAVSLPTSLDDAVLSLVFGLEDQFGPSLIKHFILYLSFFEEGVSEMELRDLLLQTPCILDDLLKYSRYKADETNVASVLTMLVSKIFARLKYHTKRRSRHNKQVYTWNHPQYREICLQEYCKVESEEKVLAEYPAIMDMFTYHDGVNVKVTTDATAWQILANEISPQYLHADSLHKLHLLPTLIASATPDSYLDRLKESCFCNFTFLVSKLMGMGVEAAIKDIQNLVTENDLEMNLLKYFLKVCSDSLSVHPQNLASQLLGCVPYLDRDLYPHMSHMLDKVVEWLMESEEPLLVPLLPCFQTVTEPCRSKLHNTIEVLAMDETGTLAVMKSKDGYIEVWDMVHEERAFYLGVKYDKTTPNIYVSTYRVLGINGTESYKIWEIKSGRLLTTVNLSSLLGTVSALVCLAHTDEFEHIGFHMMDDDFNQRVVVIATDRKEIIYDLSTFDVKDEFFNDSALFLNGGQNLLFVNARSEATDNDQTVDILKLNNHGIKKKEAIFSVKCGTKKLKKLLQKDNMAILGYQNCSFDVYDCNHGNHIRTLSEPDQDLFCQSCKITEDGYLVSLATSGMDYSLWFWEVENQISSELFSGTLSTKETDVPRDFTIIEELHIAVLGTPESSMMLVWDLPSSECIYKHQVHGAGLDKVVRSKDPYSVYTCSTAEKLVKLWDLYAVIETYKHGRSQNTISFDEDDDLPELFLPEGDGNHQQDISPAPYTPQLETVESVGSCASPNFSLGSNEGILKRPGSTTGGKLKRPKSVRFRDEVTDEPHSLEIAADVPVVPSIGSNGSGDAGSLSGGSDGSRGSGGSQGSPGPGGSLVSGGSPGPGGSPGSGGSPAPGSLGSDGQPGSDFGSGGSFGSGGGSQDVGSFSGGSFSYGEDGSLKSGSNQAELSAGSPDQSVLFSNRNEKTMKEQMEAMVEVSNISFNQTESQFLTGKLRGMPIIWDTFSGVPALTLSQHSTRDVCVPWVEFACRDQLIVGLTDNGEEGEPGYPKQYEYQVWEAESGIPVLHPTSGKALMSPTAAVTSDREMIMLMNIEYCDPEGNDKAELLFKMFDIEQHQCLREYSVLHPGVPTEIQLSNDNLYCVTLSPKVGDTKVKTLGTLFLEDKKDQDPQLKAYKFPVGKKKRNGVTSHVIWQNALGLVAGMHGDIQLWDMATGEYEENVYHDPTVKEKADPNLQNHGGKMVNHMVISSNCRYLFEGSKDGTASLWDLENEVMLHSYAGHSDEVCQVAISEECDLLLSAGKDNVLMMWRFGQMDKPICRLFIHVAASVLRITQDKRTVVAIGKPPNEPPKLIVLKVINV